MCVNLVIHFIWAVVQSVSLSTSLVVFSPRVKTFDEVVSLFVLQRQHQLASAVRLLVTQVLYVHLKTGNTQHSLTPLTHLTTGKHLLTHVTHLTTGKHLLTHLTHLTTGNTQHSLTRLKHLTTGKHSLTHLTHLTTGKHSLTPLTHLTTGKHSLTPLTHLTTGNTQHS